MKSLILFFALVAPPDSTFPTLEELFVTIEHHYQRQTNAKLEAFKAGNSTDWLKYVPNIGTLPDPTGKMRPTIGFSFSTIYHLLEDKREKQQQKKSVEKHLALDVEIAKHALMAEMKQLAVAKEDYEDEKLKYEVEHDIYEEKKKAYNAEQISHIEVLESKRLYLDAMTALKRKERVVKSIQAHILKMAYYDEENQILSY